jgi:DnaJ domain
MDRIGKFMAFVRNNSALCIANKHLFSMVINSEDLQEDLKVGSADLEIMKTTGRRMSYLKPIRDKLCQSTLADRCVQSERLTRYHYKTLHFLELMKQGQKGDFITFIEELNGVIARNHQPDNLKTEMILGCKKRIDDFVLQDKQKRANATNDVLLLEGSERAKEMQNVRERVASPDRTYYSILGVKTDASTYEISKAYRNLSYLFHPDKCPDIDATSIFQQLSEAKETLCCPVKRAMYDETIGESAP